METFDPRPETRWIVQPLVDAGLPPEQICVLVTRLGFEAVVAGGPVVDARVLAVVADQPRAVQAAWVEVIDRMTTPSLPA